MTSPIAADLERADLCRRAYDAARETTWSTPGLCRAFLDQTATGPVVTFEGTRPTSLADWLTDMRQMPLHLDPAFGPLPDGFGSAVLSVLFRIFRTLDGKTVLGFNGHSMGGANALIAAALWKHSGGTLGRVTAFEPPHVGLLGGRLEGEDVLITRCGFDPVPHVPVMPPFHCHPAPATDLANAGGWSAVGCHEIENVTAALAKMVQGSST